MVKRSVLGNKRDKRVTDSERWIESTARKASFKGLDAGNRLTDAGAAAWPVGEVKIKELVHALDMRKDEAIERTFKGVAKHFREIFAELAPGGRGELVMQKRLPGNATEDGAEEMEDEMVRPNPAPLPPSGARPRPSQPCLVTSAPPQHISFSTLPVPARPPSGSSFRSLKAGCFPGHPCSV